MASRHTPTYRSVLDLDKVFFDVETPNCASDRICSFSALFDSGETITRLVDPEAPFNSFNIAIHGITPRMVLGEPNFRSIWNATLRDKFRDKTIVGYNVTFDLRVLIKTLRSYDLPVPVLRYVDVLTAARRYFDLDAHSLSDVMDELGVSFRHHDASEDVRATKIAFDVIARDAPELLREKIYNYDEPEIRPRW